MTANIAESARSVSEHVEALLATKVSEVDRKELKQSISNLKSALADVQNFVDNVEGVAEIVSSGGRIPDRLRGARRKSRRRGRSPDDFPVTDFILQSLQDNPKGLRPVELKEMMKTKAPGKHSQPSATISTTLTRLKKKGQVLNKGGRWVLRKRARG